jgi:hypothetical protein
MAREARPNPRRGNPALRLAAIRRFHSYVGVFIAPSVLFFALTGALQTLQLHEAWGTYQPPALIAKLARVHKDQVFSAPRKPARPPAATTQAPRPPQPPEAGPKPATVALKWFFVAVAMGLIVSTILGLWMTLAHNLQKRSLWLLFLAGAAVPLALLIV